MISHEPHSANNADEHGGTISISTGKSGCVCGGGYTLSSMYILREYELNLHSGQSRS